MIRRLVLPAAAALLAFPGVALAAPARTVTVSADAPVATWEGGPGNGAGVGTTAMRCAPVVYECEDTLVDVKAGGDLLAEITGDDTAFDLDVAIYESDADGTAPGVGDEDNPMAQDISTNKDAKVRARRLDPGFYVVRVRFFNAVAAFYTGTATLELPPPPPAPTTPAPTTPPPAEPGPGAGDDRKAKRKKARAKCKRKAKRIKNKKKRKAAVKRCKRKG